MGGLTAELNQCAQDLRPQKQGTCGLYSVWFSSLLLSKLPNSTTQPSAYPRKGVNGGPKGSSLRSYAKQEFGSAQGEVLSIAEMLIITRKANLNTRYIVWTDEPTARRFISGSLSSKQPVLFPYLFGANGLESAVPNHRQCGPHWSVIYDEEQDVYNCLEPNNPNTPVRWLKSDVLKSNAIVDDFKMDRFWEKMPLASGPAYQQKSPIRPMGNDETAAKQVVAFDQSFDSGAKLYDVGANRAQSLSHLLVAVY